MERIKIACGDSHGIVYFENLIRYHKLKSCDIYHVGDFGVGFIEKNAQIKNLEALNTLLKSKDIRLYVTRGNHDNPIYWKEEIYRTDNIWFVPSYTVIENTLFLGGAISIDRMYRIAENAGWWEDEVFEYQDCSNLTGIFDVISHTAPHFCLPVGFNKLVNEFISEEEKNNIFTLKPMLIEERQLMTKVYENLCLNNFINNWLYGHFHASSISIHNDTKFTCLSINELKQF
jgi:hypothetical protein